MVVTKNSHNALPLKVLGERIVKDVNENWMTARLSETHLIRNTLNFFERRLTRKTLNYVDMSLCFNECLNVCLNICLYARTFLLQ